MRLIILLALIASCTVRDEPYMIPPTGFCYADAWNERLGFGASENPPVWSEGDSAWQCSTACAFANVRYEEHACYVVGDFDLDGTTEGGWINYVTDEFDRPGGCLVSDNLRMIRFFYCDEGVTP